MATLPSATACLAADLDTTDAQLLAVAQDARCCICFGVAVAPVRCGCACTAVLGANCLLRWCEQNSAVSPPVLGFNFSCPMCRTPGLAGHEFEPDVALRRRVREAGLLHAALRARVAAGDTLAAVLMVTAPELAVPQRTAHDRNAAMALLDASAERSAEAKVHLATALLRIDEEAYMPAAAELLTAASNAGNVDAGIFFCTLAVRDKLHSVRTNPAEVMEMLRAAASELNRSTAWYALGLAVALGYGGKQPNLAVGAEYLFRAASRGHVGAMEKLGKMLVDGALDDYSSAVSDQDALDFPRPFAHEVNYVDGVTRDAELGILWLRAACLRGSSSARRVLGHALISECKGDFSHPSAVLAASAFARASEEGSLEAQHCLAILLRHGVPLGKCDHVKALRYYENVARHGRDAVRVELGLYLASLGEEHERGAALGKPPQPAVADLLVVVGGPAELRDLAAAWLRRGGLYKGEDAVLRQAQAWALSASGPAFNTRRRRAAV